MSRFKSWVGRNRSVRYLHGGQQLAVKPATATYLHIYVPSSKRMVVTKPATGTRRKNLAPWRVRPYREESVRFLSPTSAHIHIYLCQVSPSEALKVFLPNFRRLIRAPAWGPPPPSDGDKVCTMSNPTVLVVRSVELLQESILRSLSTARQVNCHAPTFSRAIPRVGGGISSILAHLVSRGKLPTRMSP